LFLLSGIILANLKASYNQNIVFHYRRLLALKGIPTGAITIFPLGFDKIGPGESQKFKIIFNAKDISIGEYAGVYTAVSDQGVIMQKDTIFVVKEKLSGATMFVPTIKRLASWISIPVFLLLLTGFIFFIKFSPKKSKKNVLQLTSVSKISRIKNWLFKHKKENQSKV
jgi:hypothetical protein